MMNKKIVIAIVALVALVGIFLGIFFLTKPETQQGAKQITVIVVHKDGTQKTFTYHTDEEYLDKVLIAEGLMEGHDDQYGLVIDKVALSTSQMAASPSTLSTISTAWSSTRWTARLPFGMWIRPIGRCISVRNMPPLESV